MWRKLLSKINPDRETDRLLVLEREKQDLRLELVETERKLAAVQLQLERLRDQQEDLVVERTEAYKTKLFSGLSGMLVQFFTQIHLSEVEGKPVKASDVLAVAKSLLRLAQNQGLAFNGQIGEIHDFDLDWHETISSETSISRGDKVTVRVPGVSYQGQVLRKAGVSRVEKENE